MTAAPMTFAFAQPLNAAGIGSSVLLARPVQALRRKVENRSFGVDITAYVGETVPIKTKAYHRTDKDLKTFRPGTFFCVQPITDTMYGDRLYTVELTVSKPASDDDVLAAARELGLESETVDNPYEYLSPGLMDACVTRADVTRLMGLLAEKGFDCAHVTDCDCPKSWVIFRSEQVNILEVA